MDDVTPASVMAGFWRWFGIGVLATALIVGLLFGARQLGWIWAKQDVNRSTQIIQGSNSNQVSLVNQLDTQIGNVLTATTQLAGLPKGSQQYADIHAQRLGFARLACTDADQITITIPASQRAWIKVNCLDGTLNPASPLNK
jgi:hypothetical protein